MLAAVFEIASSSCRDLKAKTEAERTIMKQQRVHDMCNRYSGKEIDDQCKSPVI